MGNVAELSISGLRERAAILRDRASHCVEMASRAVSIGVADELWAIAAEYERDAVTQDGLADAMERPRAARRRVCLPMIADRNRAVVVAEQASRH